MDRETFGLPKLELPPRPEPTPEELARRRRIGEEIRQFRDKIGPIDLTWEELMAEEDEDNNGGTL